MADGEKNGQVMGPAIIILRTPITVGSETVRELTIRPAKAKDLRHLEMKDGYVLDTLLRLCSRLTGQPDPVIDELSGEDLAEVMKVVGGFMPGSQPTGSTPSPS